MAPKPMPNRLKGHQGNRLLQKRHPQHNSYLYENSLLHISAEHCRKQISKLLYLSKAIVHSRSTIMDIEDTTAIRKKHTHCVEWQIQESTGHLRRISNTGHCSCHEFPSFVTPASIICLAVT